jgi:hypothetical protein
MGLHGGRERREIDPETESDAIEVLEPDVAEAALDAGDVRHVQSGPVGEILL